MMGFVFRLVPPRPSFAADMSAAERETIRHHVGYWAGLTQQGKVLAYGPVNDPRGPYGIGIILADDQAEAEALRDGDPAVQSPHGFTTDLSPMVRLVTPTGVYDAVAG
jgi:uncharacterized protein YciI